MLKILKNNRVLIILNDFKILSFFKKPLINSYIYKSLDVFFFGKTYKWSLKKKTFRLVFNRAHKTFIYFNIFLKFKKTAKTKIRFFINNNCNFNTLNILLYKTRRYNIFTQRGIKIKNTNFYKKRGKVSTYK